MSIQGWLSSYARHRLGVARAGAARVLDEPVDIAGRTFVSGCDLTIDALVPYPGGVELQPLVRRLAAFPKPEAWSVYLRRPLVPLGPDDATLIGDELRPLLVARDSALASYPTV